MTRYVGRFAPSPTGPLHAGSLVAALASWLDARSCGGQWLLRIEDVDTPRCSAAAAHTILAQLCACGLAWDGEVLWQSTRSPRYQQALAALQQRQLAYPCGCTRRDIDAALAAQGRQHERHGERPYPGTCREGLNGKPARAWRFNTQKFMKNWPSAHMQKARSATFLIDKKQVHWQDRRLGEQQQDVAHEVGDFILHRADGLWAYQLAVVVDDGDQGVTDVVRGEDLADNTPRQILLHNALGLPTPRYLHTPLVCGANGEKLSKQNGAQALDLTDPVVALSQAAQALGLPALAPSRHHSVADALAHCLAAWRRNYNRPS